MNLIKLALAAEQMALAKDRSPVKVTPIRCVRRLHKETECDICEQVCPAEAITVTDQVRVDGNRCIRCGLCLNRCPVGVFEGSDGVDKLLGCVDQIAEREQMELACSHHPAPASGPGSTDSALVALGCLSALGPSVYVSLLALGVDRLSVRLDACADCPVGAALHPRIVEAVQQAQAVMSARGEDDRLSLVSDAPAEQEPRPVYYASNPPLSRRGFLQFFTPQNRATAADILPPYAPQIDGDRSAPRERRRLLGALRLLGEAPADQHLPAGERYADMIVDEKCTACGVCARICPNEALLFEPGDGEFWLGFVAANCTNCDLCTRYCDPDALHLNGTPTVSRLTNRPILLRHDTLYKCQKCSAPYSGDENGGFCPICAFKRDNPFSSRLPASIKDKLKPATGSPPSG